MELEILKLNISNIVKSSFEIKYKNDFIKLKLTQQIKETGLINPLLVRPLENNGVYEIVDGNLRYEILKEIGSTFVFCSIIKLNKLQAIKLAIEINGDVVELDHINLSKVMRDLIKEYTVVKLENTMPFLNDQIVRYPDMLKFDWSIFDKESLNQEEFNF